MQMKLKISLFYLLGIASLPNVCGQGSNQGATAPYLTFRGSIIQNNSQVQLFDVGDSVEDGVQCHTDLPTCCNSTSGQWSTGGQNFSENTGFGEGLLSLHSLDDFQSGNYRCEIDTIASITSGGSREILYVGIFQGASLHVSLSLDIYENEPHLFTLTCFNSFAPATIVTWTRDSEKVDGGVTVRVRRLQYKHVLNTTEEGVYTCTVMTVSTWRDETDSHTLNITTPLAPTNLTVSQNGLDSVLVSWIPTGRPERYSIYYREEGNSCRRVVSAGPDDTSVTVSNLLPGRAYPFSIIARTSLQSTEVGPVNITIDYLAIGTGDSARFSGAYPGQVVKFTCEVTLMGTLTGTPVFSWQAPGPIPTPTVSSPRERVFSSDFIVNSINSSHVGTYTCTASLENFPFTVKAQNVLFINPQLHLSVQPSIRFHSRQPLQFTLTCTSTGGFPMFVTWTKDSDVIGSGMTVLEDFRRYHHTLNATEEGVYNCTIANDMPDSATATFNAILPLPPTSLQVSQMGLERSVLVSWTPSKGADYYTIYYGQHGQQIPQRVEAGEDSVTIALRFPTPGAPFSFSIFALTALPSVEVGPVNITLRSLRVYVYKSRSTPVIGRQYMVTCVADVNFNVTNNPPAFVWQGPGELPVPVTPPSDPTTSVLTFSPLKLSNGGEYSCSVVLDYYNTTQVEEFVLEPVIPNYLYPTMSMISVVASHTAPFYTGTALTLTCEILLNAAIDIPVVSSIQWVVGGVEVDSSISTDRVTFSEQSVVFFPLNTSDSATYSCNVHFMFQLYNNIHSEEFDLNVNALPPPMVEITTPSTAVVGHSLTLQCEVTTVPHLTTTPHVELIGPGGIVLASTDTSLNLSHILDRVLASHAGQQYVCMATLDIDELGLYLRSQSTTNALTVQIPSPTVTTSADPTDTVVVGSSLTLTCTATVDPSVDSFLFVIITWAGRRISSDGLFSANESGYGLIHNSSITIPDVTEDDQGDYTCITRISGGRNILGNTVTQVIPVSVYVPRPVVIVSSSSSDSIVVSSSITLTCDATFDPQLDAIRDLLVSFMWDGPRVVDGNFSPMESVVGLTYTSRLMLSNVASLDEGKYTCTVVVSSAGSTLGNPVTDSTAVIVIAPPPPVVELTSFELALAGKDHTIQCAVTDLPLSRLNPPVHLELIGPGEVVLASTDTLNLSYVLKYVLTSYAGQQYACKASVEIVGFDEPLVSQSSIYNLTVLIPIPDYVTFSHENQLTGLPLTFICTTILDPAIDVVVSVTVLWSGPRIRHGEDGYTITESQVGLNYTSNLTIQEAMKDDEGEYSFNVTVSSPDMNIRATKTEFHLFVIIIVTGPRLLITVSPPGIIDSGTTAVLTCEATWYAPLDSVQLAWTGPPINYERYSIEETQSKFGMEYTSNLTIFALNDTSNYECTLRGFEENGVETRVTESVLLNVTKRHEPEQRNNAADMSRSTLSFIMTMLGLLRTFSVS